ncbi:MAG: hypothetical protein HYY83_02035 [Deltaproteobacteria bacterium]|nr:hypothetical protein [Deltaproteobacteria bacterium]
MTMARQEFKFVGRNVHRVDGIEKVTGKAKFTGDIRIPGMLYGRILRSSYPHARILNIDSSRAEALPGVSTTSFPRPWGWTRRSPKARR